MLVDTNVTVAHKCSACGSFSFSEASIFMKPHNIKNAVLGCGCNRPGIIINKLNKRDYKLEFLCFACEKKHAFVLSRKELFRKGVYSLYCPQTRIQQCFIGNDDDIRNAIDNMENKLEEVVDDCGYEHYFKNNQVMLAVLNKIHEIAEKGNIICECGNNEVYLMLFPDKVILQCKNCAGESDVYAATNGDLKDVQLRRELSIVKNVAKGSCKNT